MGWLKKKIKQLGRGIKKVGKKIGGAFKKLLKPFAKMFNKLGPLGSIAMMMILPGIGQMLAGWGAGMGNFMGTVIQHVGNAINFVATAPQKIFQTITGGISSAWNAMTGNLPLGSLDPITGIETKQSWWGNFSDKVSEAWKNPGVRADDIIGVGGDTIYGGVGEDTFWDVSKIGEKSARDFKTDWGTMKTEVGDVFKKGDKKGFFGRASDIKDNIGDITIPGVGEVKDVAWGTSAALGAYSTLAQYGIIGSEDDPYGVGGGMTIRAEEQLYGGDQGGMYNITPPTWSYDYNQTFAQNQESSRNIWNNAYGLPEGFDSSSMGGYGFGYDQWFMEAMGFRPIR